MRLLVSGYFVYEFRFQIEIILPIVLPQIQVTANITTSVPLSSTQTPSVQHRDHTFSAPKIPQFNTKIPQFHTKQPSVQQNPQSNTKNSSVQQQKPLSSTPITPQFNTKTPSVLNTPSVFLCWAVGFLMLNYKSYRGQKIPTASVFKSWQTLCYQ